MRSSLESEILFGKDIQVASKQFDQRQCTLHISVSWKSSFNKKELHIQLTNPDDLLFLHSCSLTDEDFSTLKSQQGLLVDFLSFPQKFVELLELCISEEKKTSPKFLLTFDVNSSTQGILEIVEANPFKHLVHLSLKLLQGNDQEVKSYLASCLANLQEENSTIKQNLSSTERELSNRLSGSQQMLNERTKELNELRAGMEERICNATTSLERELNEAKSKYEELQQNSEHRMERERSQHDSKFNSKVSDLEEKLSRNNSSNKDLLDQKYRLESLVRDLKSRLSHLEEEKQLLGKDVQTLRRQNNNFDTDRHERDKTLNHLRTRVAVLEQEIKDKQQVILRMNDHVEAANIQKKRDEKEVVEKSNHVQQLHQTVQSVSAEVIKGNEIIQKLQAELRTVKSRVKMMGIVTTKQEKVIEEKELQIQENKKTIAILKSSDEQHQNEVVLLKKTMEEVSRKYDETQETIKNNENVISWLNKQLNEQTRSSSSSSHQISSSHHASTSARIPYNTTATAMPYRPILKKPQQQQQQQHPQQQQQHPPPQSQQQAQQQPRHLNLPIGISPIPSSTFNNNNIMGRREPLKMKQQNMSTPLNTESDQPLFESKYLTRRNVSGTENEPRQNTDLKKMPLMNTVNPAKPFLVPSAYFKN